MSPSTRPVAKGPAARGDRGPQQTTSVAVPQYIPRPFAGGPSAGRPRVSQHPPSHRLCRGTFTVISVGSGGGTPLPGVSTAPVTLPAISTAPAATICHVPGVVYAASHNCPYATESRACRAPQGNSTSGSEN